MRYIRYEFLKFGDSVISKNIMNLAIVLKFHEIFCGGNKPFYTSNVKCLLPILSYGSIIVLDILYWAHSVNLE